MSLGCQTDFWIYSESVNRKNQSTDRLDCNKLDHTWSDMLFCYNYFHIKKGWPLLKPYCNSFTKFFFPFLDVKNEIKVQNIEYNKNVNKTLRTTNYDTIFTSTLKHVTDWKLKLITYFEITLTYDLCRIVSIDYWYFEAT